jgi:hypothetical protein
MELQTAFSRNREEWKYTAGYKGCIDEGVTLCMRSD